MFKQYLAPCVMVLAYTISIGAEPNFLLRNNSQQAVHFVVLGVDDLFGLRNGKFEATPIATLAPGAQYVAEIGIRGLLPKPVQIAFYPNGQGIQPTLAVPFQASRRKRVVHIPMGAQRVYLLNTRKPIELELLEGLELVPQSGARIQGHHIVRSANFETFADWSANQKNHKKFCDYMLLVYPFVYELTRAGSIRKFVWNWPLQGIPWALKVKWAEHSFRKSTGITLVSQQEIAKLSSELGP